MNHHITNLLQKVLGLTLADRQAFVEEVMKSIEEDSFKAELKRRRDEYPADKSCSVPSSAIFDDDKSHQPKDDFAEKAIRSMRRAVRKVYEERAAQNETVSIWRDGKVMILPAKELLRELNENTESSR